VLRPLGGGLGVGMVEDVCRGKKGKEFLLEGRGGEIYYVRLGGVGGRCRPESTGGVGGGGGQMPSAGFWGVLLY
jgi:hypothetical protein